MKHHVIRQTLGIFSALSALLVTLNPAFAQDEKRETLAAHDTIAIYNGKEYRLCEGKSTLCPDRCDGSGEWADFSVVGYRDYKKLAANGDPKQTSFSTRISDFHKKPAGDAKVRETVAGLKQGDYVLLAWHYDNVTVRGSSDTDVALTKLEKISKEQAAELLKALNPKPPPAQP